MTPKPRRPDFVLCIPIVALLCLGLVMVRSASGIRALELYHDADAIFVKQLIALAIGLILLVVLAHIPHRLWRHPLPLYSAIGVVTLLLVAVLQQPEANGAHRWFFLGSFGFQPSDLAKVVLIMLVAARCGRMAEPTQSWLKRLLPIGVVLVTFAALILLQPDFGTTMILIFIVGAQLFLAGLPIRYFLAFGLLLLPIAAGLIYTEPYRIQRIRDFRAKKEHPQTLQSKIALGAGGLTGVGLGEGRQKLYFLPEAHTDFIFSTLGEELGFLGTMFVVAMYLLFLGRGLIVVRRVDSLYARLLGSGMVLLISCQALFNISVSLALFPNKGLTLPFLSAGGTSLILCLGMAGILLNISRYQLVDNRVAA